jgi:tripartite-type tricarboxylate transporter receptor subunit TctC
MSSFESGALARRRLLQAVLAACAACAAPAVLAQADYPTRPITIVVPFPAGGPTDASARLYAKVMGQSLGQAIVIDNRAGAAGTVGSAFVARAPADGYTLLWGGTSTLAVAPGLYKNLKYEAQSFEPIGMALRGPLMIAASNASGITSVADLVQKAKTRNLTVGTAGSGSIGHLATELLAESAKITVTHVPYRGGGPALTDALGGQIDLIFDNASALYPHVKAGKLRAIAVAGAQPYAPAPEIPTLRAGLRGDYEAYSWFGLVAPQGTPEAVMKKLRVAFAAAVDAPEVRRELSDMGLEPGVADARAFGAVIAADYRKWSGIINRAGVTAD